jgi:excisionase family DNA binding protein
MGENTSYETELNHFYTILEVAEDLHISRTTMYKLLKVSSFPTIKIGSKTLIPKNEYQKWLKENLNNDISI